MRPSILWQSVTIGYPLAADSLNESASLHFIVRELRFFYGFVKPRPTLRAPASSRHWRAIAAVLHLDLADFLEAHT